MTDLHTEQARDSFPLRILRIFQQGFADHRRVCLKVMTTGFLCTAFQAAALLSLIPIIRYTDASRALPAWDWMSDGSGFPQYLAYTGGICLLFIASVRMRYIVFSLVYDVSVRFAVDCTERVFVRLHAALPTANRAKPAVQELVNRCLFRVSTACSVLFRQMLFALNDAFLLIVFLAVLFYLSPAATFAIMLLSAPLAFLYARSYRVISARAEKVDRDRRKSRTEVTELIDVLRDANAAPDEVGARVRNLLDGGYSGEVLFGQAAMRRDMKGSSAVVELITPIAIVIIALVLFFSESLGFELATILIYYIVLRQSIGAASQIADSLIMINRVYPDLRDYAGIMARNTSFLDAWFDNVENTHRDAVALEST